MFTIGIAGGSCSGKTTLTNALEARYTEMGKRVIAIHMDTYFKNPVPTVIAPFTGVEYPENNHPDAVKLDELYAALDTARASDADVVIVEGLMILHLDEIRNKLDLKIFVDLMSDERMFRRIKRFMRDRGQTMDEVAIRYLDTVRYRHNEFVEPSRWYADMVLNGAAELTKSCDIITAYTEARGR
ncbi:MAG: AAA family ATPase [Clostridia bacterium]|nr:AAA family ATPase [Clostridia bacterium]